MKPIKLIMCAIAMLAFAACEQDEIISKDKHSSETLEQRAAPGKVWICHLNENGEFEEKEVPIPSLQGHLSHGDIIADEDNDGYTKPTACFGSKDDCDDNDATIYPGATEIPDDNIDQDCNGEDEISLVCRCFTRQNLEDLYDYTWNWGWYNLIDANCQPNPLYQGTNDIVLLDAELNGTLYNTGAGTIAYPDGTYNISYSRFNKSTNQFEENCYWFVPYEEYLPCKLLMDQFLDDVVISHPEWDYCVRF